MTEVEFNAAVSRLRDIDKQIQSAEVEVRLRENRLAELRPKREALEDQATQEFECSIRDLPKKITEVENKFAAEVDRLESDVRQVSSGS